MQDFNYHLFAGFRPGRGGGGNPHFTHRQSCGNSGVGSKR